MKQPPFIHSKEKECMPMVQHTLSMVRARGHEILASLWRCEGQDAPKKQKWVACLHLAEILHNPVAPTNNKREPHCDSLLLLVRARGLDSRRDDAKPRLFRLCYAPRSVAALTCHRHVIHYRSPSNPLVLNRTKKQGVLLHSLLFWCGQEDLNLHRVAPTRT